MRSSSENSPAAFSQEIPSSGIIGASPSPGPPVIGDAPGGGDGTGPGPVIISGRSGTPEWSFCT